MHEQCWYVTSNLQKFRPRFLRHCGPMYKVGCNSDNKIFLRTNNSTNINKTNYHLSPSDWIQKMRDHDIWHWKSRSLFVNFNKGHRGRDRMVVDFLQLHINQCLSQLMLWVRISIRARCITLCDKVCQWLARVLWFSLGTPVSSTNKTDRHDIAEILLKVALNTIIQTNKQSTLIIIIM
jgi:hypothetical protein